MFCTIYALHAKPDNWKDQKPISLKAALLGGRSQTTFAARGRGVHEMPTLLDKFGKTY